MVNFQPPIAQLPIPEHQGREVEQGKGIGLAGWPLGAVNWALGVDGASLVEASEGWRRDEYSAVFARIRPVARVPAPIVP